VIGIIFQSSFLEALSSPIAGGRRARILDHLEHVIHVVGDTVAAIGTDYDGAIVPPADLPDVTDFPLLVQDMLDRGWSEERITRVLGANYLRVAAAVRALGPEKVGAATAYSDSLPHSERPPALAFAPPPTGAGAGHPG
jgi:membrane dipeptidase